MAATLDDLLTVLEDQSKRFANIEDLQRKATAAIEKTNSKSLSDKEDAIIRKRIADEERLLTLLKDKKIKEKDYNEGVAKVTERFNDVAKEIETAGGNTVAEITKRFANEQKLNEVIEKSLRTYSTSEKIVQIFGSSVKGAATLITSSFNSAATSSTGISGALNMATDTVKLVGNAFKFVSENASSLAVTLALVQPELAVALGAVSGVSKAAGEAIGFFANNIMPILNRNIENMSKGFHEAASAGALFTGGITELRESAHAAGLGTEDFAKGLKEFSADFVALGGDVTNGGRRFVAITQQMSKNLGGDYRNSFLQLGYSINEIPGIIAKVGAEASRAVGGASNQQVAQAVQDYAKNLRLIADLTGQDAKTLQQKADAEFKDLKFREFLNKNVPAEQRAAVKNMLAALPADELELVKSRIVGFGNISDSVAGIIGDQIPAYAESSQQIFQLLASGKSSVEAIADIDQGASKAAALQKSNLDDFATGAIKAGGDIAAAASKIADGFDQTLATANRTEADYERAKANNLAAATANLGEETNALIALEKQTTDAFIAQENATKDALSTYAEGVKLLNDKTINLINGTGSLIDFIKDNIGTPAERSRREHGNPIGTEAGSVLGTAGGLVAGAEGGALAGAAIGSVVPVVGTAIGGAIGTALGAVVGAYFGNEAGKDVGSAISDSLSSVWNNMTGHEFGGIASGPSTGYLAKLHGTEAILPENLTNMLLDVASNPSNNSKNDEVYKMIDNSISTPMNQQTDLMQTLISKVDQLIDATKDVATYTERTSMRVA